MHGFVCLFCFALVEGRVNILFVFTPPFVTDRGVDRNTIIWKTTATAIAGAAIMSMYEQAAHCFLPPHRCAYSI